MSTASKVRRKRASVLHYADDYLVEDENGEEFAPRAGEWVKLSKRFPLKLIKVASRLQNLAHDKDADEGAATEEAFESLIDMLAPFVVEWNWTNQNAELDENGNYPPLPAPTVETLWELDMDELLWLVEKFQGEAASPNG